MSAIGTVLVYAIHRTEDWWGYVAKNLGYGKSIVVTDIRGAGDYSVVDDFYAEYHRQAKLPIPQTVLLMDSEIDDVIARCRLLRWLPKRKAAAMVCAMAHAFDRVLEIEQPSVIVSFPIDRYVSDILERLGKKRGIPYFELTASLVSEMSMLLCRGQLVKESQEPDAEIVNATISEIATPTFTPSYVQTKTKYTIWRFLKVFSYFKIRGLTFWLMSYLKNDPLNLHYLDSQSFLGHKPRLSDIQIHNLVDVGWRTTVDGFSKSKRIFFGLQLFPEASIDYWIANIEQIDYENIIVEAAAAFSKAGFLILVKDHPLQFGFRQCELVKRLKDIENVVFVPYDISGNELLDLCEANFTLTGTLGLQAALLGKKSITARNYYANDEDFITFSTKEEIAALPKRVEQFAPSLPLEQRRYRIMRDLLQGSFNGHFFTFKKFDLQNPDPRIKTMAHELGNRLRQFAK